jgi:hypothetical protein
MWDAPCVRRRLGRSIVEAGKGETMMPLLMFVLEIQSEGVRTKAVLNDIQVYERVSGKSGMAQAKLDPWIIEGSNRIQVFAALAVGGGGTPRLGLSLLVGPHGRQPAKSAESKWDPAGKPLQKDRFTLVWEHEFTPERAFGRWAWQDAAPSNLPADDRAGIVALVEEVRGAVQKGNAARLRELFRLRDSEMARALDIPEAEMSEEMNAMFQALCQAPDRKIEPIDPGALVMTPGAGGRIIAVQTAGGGPPVKVSMGEGEMDLPMSVSRIGGRWTIVR